MKLTQVPLPSKTYYHCFKRVDGTVFEVETSAEEYDSLNNLNPTYPTHQDGVWVSAYAGFCLPPNTWADEKGLQKLVNIDGKTLPVKNKQIVNDVVSADGVVELSKVTLISP